MTDLYEKYRSNIHNQLKEKLGILNPMEVPRLEKVTLNMGVGEAVKDSKKQTQQLYFFLASIIKGSIA